MPEWERSNEVQTWISERESLSLPVFATCLVQFGDHGATRAATVLYRNTGSEEV